MKRIFLTSGLVMCLACPAFAVDTIDLDASGHADGITTGEECVEDVLGTYQDGATVQLEAKWTSNISGAITLDSSVYPSNNTSAAAKYTTSTTEAVTAGAPSPVYSVYDIGIYASAANAAAQTSAITELSTDPSKVGYTFNGFYAADGTTQVIDDTGAFTAAAKTQVSATNGTATWYAHWTPNQNSVIYHVGAHGACDTSNASADCTSGVYTQTNGATYDVNYTPLSTLAAADMVANPGYTFQGWSTTSGTTTADYTGATPWKGTADLDLYAAYSANPYQITYAGGTAGNHAVTATVMSATNVHYDDTNVQLATNTYAYTGYHFTGWSGDHALDGTAATTAYEDEQVIAQYKVVGNLALTAQWAPNTTTVTYSCVMDNTVDANSQSVYTGSAPSNQTATYESNFAFAANTNCARAGWTFDGWTCTYGSNPATTLTMAAAYGTTGDNAGDTIMAAGGTAASWLYEGETGGTISCIAHYTANTINLNWYADSLANGATTPMDVPTASDSCIYDGSVTVPEAPDKKGYTFQGWTVRSTTPAQ